MVSRDNLTQASTSEGAISMCGVCSANCMYPACLTWSARSDRLRTAIIGHPFLLTPVGD